MEDFQWKTTQGFAEKFYKKTDEIVAEILKEDPRTPQKKCKKCGRTLPYFLFSEYLRDYCIECVIQDPDLSYEENKIMAKVYYEKQKIKDEMNETRLKKKIDKLKEKLKKLQQKGGDEDEQ